MFSLQKLLGKDDKFFGLLEASAEEARASVQALKHLLANTTNTPSLEEFVATRRKDKRITEEISRELINTFVTALEREDIEALSSVLYKMVKTVEKFAERYIITGGHVRNTDFSRHTQILEQATEHVKEMVTALRKTAHLEKMKALNDKLQHLEGEADKLHIELLRGLYSGKGDPLRVMALKDLYELLEKAVDRCRDAGNVITHIVLKNS